ncbi:hypothetical protein K1T73_04670 [Roseovarius sp. SCSIO 43702]|uniref:hypothetical protein n=1 Tax=Roseovarius sp. SCSIO 43702 TaxID=2823043 RepID=UPI001C730805|nr:hypothetical protein [Roseovarius sp. SCSIO 43702]QYX57688.1 hypothetical protein K1T73_04670 [Roseovarius sp. SCSIO 43702]
MFREWGFLIGEMIALLILAALAGLLAGWIIWGRRNSGDHGDGRVAKLSGDLEACRVAIREKDRKLADLEQKLEASHNRILSAAAALVEGDESDFDLTEDPPDENTEARKPETLDAPREEGPDDLKRIRGIGPKLEAMCHRLGFYHFDQIASWSDEEVAWVDDNLEGFKGRVTRDDWVAQARHLAEGGETEFSKRVDEGDVY